jgi:hypothetical protein
MTFDSFIDAWMIAAGAIEPPPAASAPDELRQAASGLRALPRLGLAEEFPGGQEQRLQTLGADWRAGAGRLPLDPAARQELLQRLFGARKRVIQECGLEPILGADGRERDPLPRSLTGGSDQPPRSAVRRFVAWALNRGFGDEVEFLGGTLAGMTLAELREESGDDRKAFYERLDALEEEWLGEGTAVRLLVGLTPVGLTFPPGTDDPFQAGQCSAPRGCTQVCPLFGASLCVYRSGCGWDTEFHHRRQDHRRADQLPARPGLPYTGGFGERQRRVAAA